MAHAWVTPETAVNVFPEFTEWKRPLSVETQTSPVTDGLTTILKGEVEDPKLPATVKVTPLFTEM